jgi:DNA-binding NarL/FixJ family response regulator
MTEQPPNNQIKFRALLVEDDPTFTLLIKRIIGNLYANSETIDFENGKDAFFYLSKNPGIFDLAIIDLGLPDISGIEIIQKINSLNPNTPILVASVISSEKSLISAIKSGARGYVLKDDSELMMKKSIEQVMQGNYPISPMLARYLFKIAQSDSDSDSDSSDLPELTKKELEVLQKISQGKSYSETAQELGVNITTIQTHIRNLYKKLNVHSQVQATNAAKKHGLI